jgi:hypothetical protein
MKALEELTPGGSEFWEDPVFCFRYIKNRLTTVQDLLIKTAGERNKLQKEKSEMEKGWIGMTKEMQIKEPEEVGMYRQGDLLFRRLPYVQDLPLGSMVERENGHILEGEATGHIHRVKDNATAKVFETAYGALFLAALAKTEIIHEDHATITLPAGNYEVIRQREYVPNEIPRQVMD